jgi:protein TonB
VPPRSLNLARLLALAVSVTAHALLLSAVTQRLSAPPPGELNAPLAVELIAAPDRAPTAPAPTMTGPPTPAPAPRTPAPRPPSVKTSVTPAGTESPPNPEPSRAPPRAPLRPQHAAATTVAVAERSTYLASVFQAIEAHKRYPAMARRRRLEGRVRVSFRLHANGTVTDLGCTGGHTWLCRAATQAVVAAAPLPQLPKKLRTQAPLTLQFRMDYVLR